MDTRYTSRSLRRRRNTDRWECSLSHTDPVTGEMSCTYHTITGKTRKVERLLDLLDEMERHPTLKRKLAPHGGTAINLFMLDVPRLSVDIDVPYIGSVSREGMLADRPRVETGMEAVAQAQGHAVEAHPGGRAGRTFRLHYRGDLSADHAKVDRIYMNRSPILPPVMQKTLVRPGLQGAHVRGRRARSRKGEGALRPREGPRHPRHLSCNGRTTCPKPEDRDNHLGQPSS